MTLSKTTHPSFLRLRFFDVDVLMQADAPQLLDLMGQMYNRFRIPISAPSPFPPLEFLLTTDTDNPTLHYDDQAWPLPPASLWVTYLNAALFNTWTAHVRSHFLIHAGAVARSGQGGLLVARSGHGKTTLTLELVRRGFKFLSDESAALSRTDSRVYPFPRTLGLRPGTLELTGLNGAVNGHTRRFGHKYLLDIEDLCPHSIGQAVPIRHVIILDHPPPDPSHDDESRKTLLLCLDRQDADFITALRRLEGVTRVQPGPPTGPPQVRLSLERGQQHAIFTAVETLCRQQRVWLLSVTPDTDRSRTFEGPARLTPASARQVIAALLENFQGGYQSAIFREDYKGRSAEMLMALAQIIGPAKIHRLHVGPLAQMADLVCDLF